MVDYSRFSKLVVSDSEGEEERPTVTRYDKPTSVTFGSPAVSASSDKWTKWAKDCEDEEDFQKEYIEDEILPPKPALPSFAPSSNNRTSPTLNGADNGKFVWGQTADEVEIRLLCPLNTKAKQVTVELNKGGQLVVKICSQVVLDCTLAHAVWDGNASPFSTEEDRFQHAMTWEVQDYNPSARCVLIRLCKCPPTPGCYALLVCLSMG
ncbi:hypothetical protein BASA81_002753 [Batrachochytrium salamandrivorans]|nr:hypothetical protein BASA81_002753 [Batrachochytrium salamandrivorans]